MMRFILVLTLLATGCSGSAATTENRPDFADVKIGLLITTGGRSGDLAGPSIGAAKVAAAHLKADHGVEVTIEQADYQGDPSLVPQLIKDLAARTEAIVIGSDDPAILPSLAAMSVPLIHAYITTDGATDEPKSYRLAPSNTLQARSLASYLVRHRRYARIALLAENAPYGQQGGPAFADAVRKEGASLVEEISFDTGGEVHTAVSSASDSGAQVLVVWTEDPAEAARVVIDVHRSNIAYQLAVPTNVTGPGFGKNAVAQIVPTAFREGILSVGQWSGPWIDEPNVRRFHKDFRKQENDIAPIKSSSIYDAVKLLSAAKTHGSIASGLPKIKDFRGVGTPITFDARREGIGADDMWGWGFTKSETAAGAEFFPAVDTGGGFFTLVPAGLKVPERFRYLIS
ncbi:MAG: ABC transporter substrate-binding protein [Actinomycetota bacterium]